MPTTRPRHQLTETIEIAHAISVAAKQWPGESRSALLRRLIIRGSAAVEQSYDVAALARRSAVELSSGKYPDAFPLDYLSELRKDWPA